MRTSMRDKHRLSRAEAAMEKQLGAKIAREQDEQWTTRNGEVSDIGSGLLPRVVTGPTQPMTAQTSSHPAAPQTAVSLATPATTVRYPSPPLRQLSLKDEEKTANSNGVQQKPQTTNQLPSAESNPANAVKSHPTRPASKPPNVPPRTVSY